MSPGRVEPPRGPSPPVATASRSPLPAGSWRAPRRPTGPPTAPCSALGPSSAAGSRAIPAGGASSSSSVSRGGMTIERCGTGGAAGRCGAVLHCWEGSRLFSVWEQQTAAELGREVPALWSASLRALLSRSGERFGAFSCFPQQAGEVELLSSARASEHGPGPSTEPFPQQLPRLTVRHGHLARCSSLFMN